MRVDARSLLAVASVGGSPEAGEDTPGSVVEAGDDGLFLREWPPYCWDEVTWVRCEVQIADARIVRAHELIGAARCRAVEISNMNDAFERLLPPAVES